MSSPHSQHHRFVFALMLLCCAASLTGCESFANVSESLFMVSPEQEKQMGDKFAKEIEKEYPLYNDPQTVAYIREIGQKIWANSGGGELAPTFYVVKNKEINAFAIPGGNVYVHTGLINAAEDEAELAGVMAHETGHVIKRHGARQMGRQQGFDLATGLLVGEESGQAAQIAAQLLPAVISPRYSRQDEAEADEVAVHTMYRANYDPLALRTFFNKLIQQYGESNSRLMSFMASHPPTSERMAHVQAMSDALPKKETSRPSGKLRQIQARLKAQGIP